MSGRNQHTRRLAIHRGMDVYGAYQDEYIGSVVDLITSSPDDDVPRQSNDRHDAADSNRNRISGEELGPFPTIGLGNEGPSSQSVTHDYGTRRHAGNADVRGIVIRPGRFNPFARPLYIPVRAVQSISMDRLIIDMRGSEIPTQWRNSRVIDE